MGTWTKGRKIEDGARMIRTKKLREHQYRVGYARSLERKRVEWDREINVEHMWEQVKRAIVESAREVCGSVRAGGPNPKSFWWGHQVKAVVKRKEDAWKEVLGDTDEDARERCLEVYKEEKRKVKGCIYQSKRSSRTVWKDESRCQWK